MQSFGATSFFVFNAIIQTIMVAFLMKTSRACTGMLSYENDEFKFLKTVNNTKGMWSKCTIVPRRARITILSLQTQKHDRLSSHKAVLYIFQNIEI